jgi:hypothetical protein
VPEKTPEDMYETEVKRSKNLERRVVDYLVAAAKNGGRQPARVAKVPAGAITLDELYENIKRYDGDLQEASAAHLPMAGLSNTRNNLRMACTELLMRDPEYGITKGVEQMLWNSHYRPLKDLEKRLKQATR